MQALFECPNPTCPTLVVAQANAQLECGLCEMPLAIMVQEAVRVDSAD